MRDFQLGLERSLKVPAFKILCIVGILLDPGNFRTSYSHSHSLRPPPTLTCSSSEMGAALRDAGLAWVRLRALRPIQLARSGRLNEVLPGGRPCEARQGILRLRGAGYSSHSNAGDQEGKGDSAEDVDAEGHAEEENGVDDMAERGKDDAIRAGGLGTAKDLGLDELSSWEETTEDEDVKKGLIRRDPHGFHGYPTLEGNVLDEALMEDEGFEIPKQNPNKHDDPEAGDIGVILTQFKPGKPLPMGSDGRIVQPPADPFAMNSPDFDNLDVYEADGVDPIDRWLGRPGHIWVKGTVPGSPAAESGLLREGDLLVSMRVMGCRDTPMECFSLRNALELIVGEPGEPIQLTLERAWTSESAVRLKKRRQRWKDHMNDDPDVRRGLQIAGGESIKDYMNELEDEDEDDDEEHDTLNGGGARARKEIVNVTLVRRMRSTFEPIANGSVEASRIQALKAGPMLAAIAVKSIQDEEGRVWSDGAHVECSCSAEAGFQGVKEALDRGGRSKRGVLLAAGRHMLGNESLPIMDGRLGGVNAHVFVRGGGDSPSLIKSQRRGDSSRWKLACRVAWLDGACVFGTPLYWKERYLAWNNGLELEPPGFLDPLHPWIRTPLYCNAGGSIERVFFSSELTGEATVFVFNGLWLFRDCAMECWDTDGRAVHVTDSGTVSMKECRVGGGGQAGIWACRQAGLLLEDTLIAGFETGLALIDDAAAFLGNCNISSCEKAIFEGNCAQLKLHGCRLEANDVAICVRATSCQGGQMEDVNEYAELEMAGCTVEGRLWQSLGDSCFKIRNFVDVGNTYTQPSRPPRDEWDPDVSTGAVDAAEEVPDSEPMRP